MNAAVELRAVRSPGVLLFNPQAGAQNAKLIEELEGRLRDGGLDVQTRILKDGEDPTCPAVEAVSKGAPWIAVAGGDGTVEAAASALIGSTIPLGVIPAGTYNNFARSLKLPLDPLEACRIIVAGRIRNIDTGIANGRPFFESLGAGLDAAIFPFGEEIKSGKLTRWFDLFRRAFQYKKPLFEIALDRPVGKAVCATSPNESKRLLRRYRMVKRKSLRLSALIVTVSNGPYYGMNFTIAPRAKLDDGLFDVTIFKHHSKAELFWHFLSIAFGRRRYCPKTISFRVAALTIDGPQKLDVHIDGTATDVWPIKIECQPGALWVFSGSPNKCAVAEIA